MIKKKLAKMLTTCLMSVFIIGTASMTVHAESVRETEPNNTMETAETIMANHETDVYKRQPPKIFVFLNN